MAERRRAITRRLFVFTAIAAFAAPHAAAQEPSYDGKRWYDVEVSIFTNEVPGGTRSEFPVARKLNAAYLPRLRELTTRSSALMIDFPEDQIQALQPATPEAAPEVPLVSMGPIYSPAVRESFKVIDFERDAFVDLDTRAAQFATMNRNIDGAADHRLLWHKVWRQPLESRAQSSAVFVSGGDMAGDHYELEGSLRVVNNGDGAMLDINIWFNEFRAAARANVFPATLEEELEEWKLPALPFTEDDALPAAAPTLSPAASPGAFPAPLPPPPELSAVWQLAQTRELDAGQLYYLDHPAVGVLIEVRPYLLPPRLPLDGQEDF